MSKILGGGDHLRRNNIILTICILNGKMRVPNNFHKTIFVQNRCAVFIFDKNAYSLCIPLLDGYVKIVWRQLELCVFCALASAGALFYFLGGYTN